MSQNIERIAVYAGSFDPITLGHTDVIERAAAMFDRTVVLIAINSKKTTLFDEAERAEICKIALSHLPNVEVDSHHGLVVDYAKSIGACALIRGIRAMSDFDYEFQIAMMNRKICPELTTIFLTPHEKYSYLNSSIVKELARYGRNVEDFVCKETADRLRDKFGSSNK